ncbi:MAG TPA: serine/threonine-protein kinase [Trebonia sp.]
MDEVPEGAGFPGGVRSGAQIAGYRVAEQIGQGGMAVVYRAWDERLQRQVALKILSPALAADESFRHRFIRESRAAAAVDHPNIIPVFEAGEAGSVLFLAMRYVPDGDARTLLKRIGPLPAQRAMAIITSVAAALDAAHAAGLVHRDVKPSNMLMDIRPGQPDHVYLADFGLTKVMQSTGSVTRTGGFLGTVDYAAPEQIEGRDVDARTDEYALACAAYELLSGTPPFPRDQPIAVLHAHLSTSAPPLSARRPGLAPEADGVLARGLAKVARFRYASCGEFAAALATALGIQPAAPEPAGRPRYRAMVIVSAVVAGLAVLATGGAVAEALLGNRSSGGAGGPAGVAATGQAAAVKGAGRSASPQPTGSAGSTSSATTTPSASSAPPSATTPQPTAGTTLYSIVRRIPDPGSNTNIDTVAFSGNGSTLLTGDKNGNACTWSVGSGQQIAEATATTSGMQVLGGAISPDGSLAVTGYDNGSASLWQASTGKLITPLSDPGSKTVDWVAFSPDGTRVAIGDANGDTYVWSIGPGGQAATRTATIRDPAGKGVWAVAFSPDSTTLATADVNGDAYLWNVADPASPTHTFTVPGGQTVTAVAFTPDGTTLVTGNQAGTTDRWQIASGSYTTISSEPDPVWGLSVSREDILAIGDGDGDTYLYNLSTGNADATLSDPNTGRQGVGAVAFSPNGMTLAAGDTDGTTYLWRTG